VIGDGIALGGSLVSYALPFLAVISITLASLLDRGATVDNENAAPLLLVTFWHCAASFLVLAPLAVGIEGLQADWNGELLFAVAWLAVVVSLAAYGLMFVLLRLLPAARVRPFVQSPALLSRQSSSSSMASISHTRHARAANSSISTRLFSE